MQYPANLDCSIDTRIRFYVARSGSKFTFKYSFPDYGDESFVQKTWEVNPEPKMFRVFSVKYKSDGGQIFDEEVREVHWNGFKDQLGLVEEDIEIVNEYYETAYGILETKDDGETEYFYYPDDMIISEVKRRTFETTLKGY
jgi:hypothetical protein